MKVLFLNPPNMESAYINRDLMGGMGISVSFGDKLSEKIISFVKSQTIRIPVMSIVYAASILNGYEVKVVDAGNLDMTVEQTKKIIGDYNPNYVISMTSAPALSGEVKMLNDVKKITNAKIGLCGDAVSFFANDTMKNSNIDFIIKGNEPEVIVKQIIDNDSFNNVKGIIYRDDKKLVDSGSPETIKDLDSLPFPNWNLFPIHAYSYFPILKKKPFVCMLSSRGCPYGCIYCPYTSNQGRVWRARSAKNVISELIDLKNKFKIKSVQFRDPIFTFSKKRTNEICNGMIENDLCIEWGCETRLDCLDKEIIGKMAEANCKGINFGVESSDPTVISNVKRKWIDPTKIKEIISYLAENGIKRSGFFIIGLPGETKKSIDNTINLALSLDLSYAEFKIATPFPGTPLFELAKKNKWIQDCSLNKMTSYTSMMQINKDLSQAYLQKKSNEAFRRFYLRPKKIIKEVLEPSFLTNIFKLIKKRTPNSS